MANNFLEKTVRDCHIVGQKFETGSTFSFDVQTAMPGTAPSDSALYVLLEHNFEVMTPLLASFMQEGLIPWGMMVFCRPGTLPPTLPQGEARGMRAEEFDQFGPDFTNFLIEELIPEACRLTETQLSSSPDMHFICGGSSGGMAAWNAVWFRNDYFRRAFLSSPTFSAMRGGEEAMVLVRKTENRPIRLYVTAGTDEPDYFFGSSLMAAQNAAASLEFAGYDFRFEQFLGEGHCTRREDETLWRRIMRFVWANWKTLPVTTLSKQIRIRNLVADDSVWQEIDGHAFPTVPKNISVNGGNYSFDGGTIFWEKNGEKTAVATQFSEITALGLSSDKWRLYIADAHRRFVYAMSILPDGSLTALYKLAPLHLAHDFRTPGALGLAVLEDDRVLAATELGVQGIVSFGLTDLILPLPGDLGADRIAVVGKTLYVSAGDKVFTRQLKLAATEADGAPTAPASPQYGDGFCYSRSRLFFT